MDFVKYYHLWQSSNIYDYTYILYMNNVLQCVLCYVFRKLNSDIA
jgi:hypothetical protein